MLLVLGGESWAWGEGVSVKRRDGGERIATYQRCEWDIQLDRTYANPFDPDEISVDAMFTGPAGRVIVVPSFWCEQSDGAAAKRAGFVARFVAPTAGRWTCSVTATDKVGKRQSKPVAFEVSAASAARGFVRRVPGNSRYLQFDSGQPYFMLGVNLAWSGDRGLAAYEKWFSKLSENGANFARIWMSHPSRMTETVQAGVGRYDQDACAFYDAVLELAERHGVYCMLTLSNHRDLLAKDMWGESTWPRFPYNAANGGPATRPSDFITDPRCQKLYRQRLRYVAARYGAYTSVAFWEFWNEQYYAKVDIPPAWTQQMARYFKSVDPYQHLVTTSFGSLPQHAVWEMPEIDLTQDHIYPNDEATDAAAPVSMSSYAHQSFDKPHLVGEFGISAYASDVKKDDRGAGTNMHNGIWAGMMSGAAGGGANWWWEDYVERYDLWRTFRGAAAFSKTVEWNRRRFHPIRPPAPLKLDAAAAPETFTDAVLPAVGMWGRSHGQRVDVLPNGQSLETLPRYIYGPRKSELRTRTALSVELPGASRMVIRVAKVSDFGVLRVSVDGEQKAEFSLSASPDSPGVETTELNEHIEPGKPRTYLATFNKDYELDLPAGRHVVTLDNVAGDWVMIDSVTIRGAKSSRYAELRVLALHDDTSGETLAWIQDPASNWRNDADGVAPRTVAAAELSLPIGAKGDVDYEVEWWDTRGGTVARRDRARATNGLLKLRVPPVTRDVAMRAIPAVPAAPVNATSQ